MAKAVAIACACDEGYAEMAGVMLRSLALNGGVPGVPVHLVGDGLAVETVAELRLCAQGLDFRFIDLGAARAQLNGLPVYFYNPAIYIRLLLPDLLPGEGRLLYLDCDILINRPVAPLLAQPLGDALAAAVIDGAAPRIRAMANARLGRPPTALYFNSGVLMFDLGTWRAQGIGHACIRLAETRQDYWPDQDALNLVLDGRIRALDAKWNFFTTEPPPRADCEAAHVVHFIPDKPISPNCRHPMFADYLALRATTPWHNRPLAASIGQRRISQLARLAAERVRQRRRGG